MSSVFVSFSTKQAITSPADTAELSIVQVTVLITFLSTAVACPFASKVPPVKFPSLVLPAFVIVNL